MTSNTAKPLRCKMCPPRVAGSTKTSTLTISNSMRCYPKRYSIYIQPNVKTS